MAARKCFANFMSVLLFVFSVLQLLCGIGFLIFGLMLQNPPKSGIPLALVIFSSVMMLTAIFGMISSCWSRRSCVYCYCIWGVAITVVELGLVLACIINPTGITERLVNTCDTYDDCNDLTSDFDRLYNYIIVGRWVFLGWVIAEFISLGVAISLSTCCSKRKMRKYDDLEADKDMEAARDRLKAVQMQNLELEGRLNGANGAAAPAGGKRADTKKAGSKKGGKAAPLSSQEQTPAAGSYNPPAPALGVPASQPAPPLPSYPAVEPMAQPPPSGGWGGSSWGGGSKQSGGAW